MGEIALVGGMVGDTLDGVTVRGLEALERAERIVFPGDWIGDGLKEEFGDRLWYGRALTAEMAVEAFAETAAGAVLYAGDPRVFTGRPGDFPSAERLAGRLESEGHTVHWFPGSSFTELALHAAGLSLDVEQGDAMVVTPALVRESDLSELAVYARTPATLVMLWAEDAGAAAWKVLSQSRGDAAQAAIVSGLGTADETVARGTLGELEQSFAAMPLPSVVVVRPAAAIPPVNVGRRLAVAVVGGARASEDELESAEQLGRALVDRGCTIICGGLGGVMEAACRGARSSIRYSFGATVGVVPTYEPNDANEFCDIVIATGLNHARNAVVAASADVIVAIGGRAGTLTEIGFGWTLGRPVIAIDSSGWAGELAGRAIDDRRDDRVYGPVQAEEAAVLCVELGSETRAGRKEF